MEPPSFNYLRPENFNKLDDKQVEQIEKLTKFHIDSFDWIIDQGLQHAIKVEMKLVLTIIIIIIKIQQIELISFYFFLFFFLENSTHRV